MKLSWVKGLSQTLTFQRHPSVLCNMRLVIAIVFCLLANISWSADFQKGISAFENGASYTGDDRALPNLA